ncbi:unnamed protein product, partial [Discosporangium mesarthrocarpum]
MIHPEDIGDQRVGDNKASTSPGPSLGENGDFSIDEAVHRKSRMDDSASTLMSRPYFGDFSERTLNTGEKLDDTQPARAKESEDPNEEADVDESFDVVAHLTRACAGSGTSPTPPSSLPAQATGSPLRDWGFPDQDGGYSMNDLSMELPGNGGGTERGMDASMDDINLSFSTAIMGGGSPMAPFKIGEADLDASAGALMSCLEVGNDDDSPLQVACQDPEQTSGAALGNGPLLGGERAEFCRMPAEDNASNATTKVLPSLATRFPRTPPTPTATEPDETASETTRNMEASAAPQGETAGEFSCSSPLAAPLTFTQNSVVQPLAELATPLSAQSSLAEALGAETEAEAQKAASALADKALMPPPPAKRVSTWCGSPRPLVTWQAGGNLMASSSGQELHAQEQHHDKPMVEADHSPLVPPPLSVEPPHTDHMTVAARVRAKQAAEHAYSQAGINRAADRQEGGTPIPAGDPAPAPTPA